MRYLIFWRALSRFGILWQEVLVQLAKGTVRGTQRRCCACDVDVEVKQEDGSGWCYGTLTEVGN